MPVRMTKVLTPDCTSSSGGASADRAQADQLTLDVSTRPAVRRKLLHSPSNDVALARFGAWRAGLDEAPHIGLLLTGPAGAGVTFALAYIAEDLATALTAGGDVSDAALPDPARPLVLDRADLVPPPVLLRLINRQIEARSPYVLGGRGNPESWAEADGRTLPDLLTRLAALPIAPLEAPDEALLAACLKQELAARQLRISDDLAGFAVERLRRSFSSLQRLARALDAEALRRQRKIDRSLIQATLNDLPDDRL